MMSFISARRSLNLALQLFSANEIDLALDVLRLNIHVYPENIETYLFQANLYLQIGEIAEAKESLLKARGIEPDNPTAKALEQQIEN